MKTITNFLVLILKKMHYAGGVLLVVSHLSQAADLTLVLTAEIPDPDPCKVAVSPSSLSENTWKINSKDIPNGKDISDTQTLTITLSECGPGSAGKAPAIKLSSPDVTPAGALPTYSSEGFFLRNGASSTSTGYWFVLPKVKTGAGFKSQDLYNLKTGDDTISLGGNGESGKDKSTEVYVAVTCATKTVGGQLDPCAGAAGTLKATLNIDFIYK